MKTIRVFFYIKVSKAQSFFYDHQSAGATIVFKIWKQGYFEYAIQKILMFFILF